MSIQKRPNGKWQARYRDPSGRQRAGSFSTKGEAKAWLAEREKEVRRGDWTDPNAAKVTVRSVYTDWIEAKNITDRTRNDYRELWRSLIEPTWGDKALRQVQPVGITRWLSELQAQGLSAARVRKAFTVLNQVMAWAVADQRLPFNPCTRVKELTKGSVLPKLPPKESNRYLTLAEVQDLAQAAGDYRAMILTMAYTGLRFGEVTALQGRDLDVLRSRLQVERAWTKDADGAMTLGTPKSGKSRTVPVPRSLMAELTPLLDAAGPSGLLFTAPEGGPVVYANWRTRVFNQAAKSAGLLPLKPHDLRHTYAALQVQAGANPKALQSALGHSDIRLTLDTYGGLFDEDMDALGARLDEAILKANARGLCAEDTGSVSTIPSSAAQ